MFKLFIPLLEIAFFRREPDILPSNQLYTILVCVLYVIATSIAFKVSNLPLAQLLPTLFITLLAYFSLCFVTLTFANKKERIEQTFTALVGVDVVITLMILPAVFLLVNFPIESFEFQLGQISYFLSLFWSVAAIAVILNSAIGWSHFFGFVVAPVFYEFSFNRAAFIPSRNLIEGLHF